MAEKPFGLPIKIEYRAGDIRTGVGGDGKEWSKKMKTPYGHIPKTEGLDGEELDVYVGSDTASTKVFAIQQMKAPDFTKLDEQKFMLGFGSAAEARKAYLENYPNPKFLGSMKEMALDDFKTKLKTQGSSGQKVAGLDRYTEINLALLGAGEKIAAAHVVGGIDAQALAQQFAAERGVEMPYVADLGPAAAFSGSFNYPRPRAAQTLRSTNGSGRTMKISALSERGAHIADRIDDVGIATLAAPYAAKGLAATLAHRPGRLGMIGRAAGNVAEHMHNHENKYELAGLAMVAPGLTHRAASAVDKKLPVKTAAGVAAALSDRLLAAPTPAIGSKVVKTKTGPKLTFDLSALTGKKKTAAPVPVTGALARLRGVREAGQAARGTVGPMSRQIKAQGGFTMQRPGVPTPRASAAPTAPSASAATQGNKTLNAAAKRPIVTSTAVPAAGATGIQGMTQRPVFSARNIGKGALAAGVGLGAYAGYKAINTASNLVQHHPHYEAASSPGFAPGPTPI